MCAVVQLRSNTRVKHGLIRSVVAHTCWQVTPHVLVVWRPDLKTYTAHLTSEANSSAAITGTINNADVPKAIVQGLGKAIQVWQEDVHVRERERDM
jgi:hypothetical protein